MLEPDTRTLAVRHCAELADNEPPAERLRVAKAYLDCKARHAALADRAK